VPQVVYKAPLDASVSDDIADLDFTQIFDHLIIGPTSYPWPIYGAFVDELKKAGVADSADRVLVSGIPIRGWSRKRKIPSGRVLAVWSATRTLHKQRNLRVPHPSSAWVGNKSSPQAVSRPLLKNIS